MNTTTVPEEATGMRNLDPAKTSPIVGAIATMLSNQRLTERDAEELVTAVRHAAVVHQPWCDDHDSDLEGEHCGRHPVSFALYEGEEKDWSLYAQTYNQQAPEIVIYVPMSASGVAGSSITPRDAFVILSALEHNPDVFKAALTETAEAVLGSRAAWLERAARIGEDLAAARTGASS